MSEGITSLTNNDLVHELTQHANERGNNTTIDRVKAVLEDGFPIPMEGSRADKDGKQNFKWSFTARDKSKEMHVITLVQYDKTMEEAFQEAQCIRGLIGQIDPEKVAQTFSDWTEFRAIELENIDGISPGKYGCKLLVDGTWQWAINTSWSMRQKVIFDPRAKTPHYLAVVYDRESAIAANTEGYIHPDTAWPYRVAEFFRPNNLKSAAVKLIGGSKVAGKIPFLASWSTTHENHTKMAAAIARKVNQEHADLARQRRIQIPLADYVHQSNDRGYPNPVIQTHEDGSYTVWADSIDAFAERDDYDTLVANGYEVNAEPNEDGYHELRQNAFAPVDNNSLVDEDEESDEGIEV